MSHNRARRFVETLATNAGITINGNKPYDIQVKNNKFFMRILRDGVLGVGETYMDGWWEADQLDVTVDKFTRINILRKIRGNWMMALHVLKAQIFNMQHISRAFQVAEKHYDVGNDLYQAMLDKRMLYTCGYWKDADNLDDAQEAKLDLVCKKIGLKEGMTVLELGCGFGSFAKYAAEKYGAQVTGLTISKEQFKFGKEQCQGLPVEIKLEDYRNVSGQYDRVISIGIMEHVGYKNYRIYMEKAHQCLKDDGIAFIHTIGGNISSKITNAWTNKYIFPNGQIPSISQLGVAMEGLFVVEDWHNFGEDYDKTLMAWNDNFVKAWPELKNQYSDRFYRMWQFYLLGCAGGFRARDLQLWQIVMTKQGLTRPDCRIS